eukprot:CAMPEP_0113901852 /NCGR_PEP_ID=MMETSP0780_2-20120614/21498_1 /TAXON_ID=652834 /ORGANISM="Palpitomonas bilix" /LENGTH=273 /DNA_ID=CAMNT_0000894539 /DNA_START=78 /DNA_END=899 /DNA_ORIENTATION=- /assembly_acc=CAM_ASM_000599
MGAIEHIILSQTQEDKNYSKSLSNELKYQRSSLHFGYDKPHLMTTSQRTFKRPSTTHEKATSRRYLEEYIHHYPGGVRAREWINRPLPKLNLVGSSRIDTDEVPKKDTSIFRRFADGQILSRSTLVGQREKQQRSADDVMEDKAASNEWFRAAFSEWDTNKDGKLSTQEFNQGVERLNLGLTRQNVDRLMVAADADGDGSVNVEEFSEAFFFKTRHRPVKPVTPVYQSSSSKIGYKAWSSVANTFVYDKRDHMLHAADVSRFTESKRKTWADF